MTQIHEGMFVLDNQVVREGWDAAKAIVTGTLEKHGGTVLTARRWDERRLAYPIRGRKRGTFVLAYYELPAENVPAQRRDFDLSEKVLRYLEVNVDAVPEGEEELARAEEAADFTVPEPPADDAPEEEPEADEAEGARARTEGDAPAADAAPADAAPAEAAAPATDTDTAAATATAEAPAAEAPAPAAEAPASPAEAPAPGAEAPAPEQPEKEEG